MRLLLTVTAALLVISATQSGLAAQSDRAAASVRWHATGAGLHRKLHLSATVTVKQDLLRALSTYMRRQASRSAPDAAAAISGMRRASSTTTFLRFLFTLPHTMYMDMDELVSLSSMDHFIARSRGSIDVEKPAHDSVPHQVAVFVPVDAAQLVARDSAPAKVLLAVPVHLRYQAPSAEYTHGNASLALPSIDMALPPVLDDPYHGCVMNADVLSNIDGNDWLFCPVDIDHSGENGPLLFQVPVGDERQVLAVVIVTVVLTVSVTALIMWVLIERNILYESESELREHVD